MQPRGVVRQRRQEDGDEIDIHAAIRAMIDLRMGEAPDPRINIRHIRKTRDLAVLVLLDLSESTNEKLGGSDKPVLQLAREATTLLSWAIDGIGGPFAIHGFASDGRHDVQYFRFKDFDERYDDDVKARLAGMQGGLSTRMGGALRHAASFLLRQPQQKKLILLVSDGEPADIDVRDPQYLRADTKKAVEELATRGITTYCLTLDPLADDYVGRIFGPNHYTVVDHVQRLPERLPTLFMWRTRLLRIWTCSRRGRILSPHYFSRGGAPELRPCHTVHGSMTYPLKKQRRPRCRRCATTACASRCGGSKTRCVSNTRACAAST